MVTRYEKVVVSSDVDPYISGLIKGQVATRAFRQEVDRLGRGGAFDNLRASSSQAFRRIEVDSQRAGRGIDSLTTRVGLLVNGIGAFGSVLAPLSTAAVPAVAGLVTQLGFAAAAGGTVLLAFQGGALKASPTP